MREQTIGLIYEKIDYYIKISLDNNYEIKFSETPSFLPFEVLDSFELDTINDTDKFYNWVYPTYEESSYKIEKHPNACEV